MSDCAIVAAATLSGLPYRKVKFLAEQSYGYAGKGLPLWAAVALAEDCLARKRTRLRVRKAGTPKTLKERFTGLVFTAGHVMPCVKGQVSNFCGHGEELMTLTVHF